MHRFGDRDEVRVERAGGDLVQQQLLGFGGWVWRRAARRAWRR
ncbi:MAG: hypothetical protein ACLP0J_16905 [Solirubrobacteraceae bacterium]